MRTQRLQTRFILAGALLVLTTVGSSLWSAWTFARLSAVVGDTLQTSQDTVDWTTALAGSLEREDDALLLAVSGNVAAAQKHLGEERERGDEQCRQLLSVLQNEETEEALLAHHLREEMDAYRKAGSDLIADAGSPAALKRYHEHVNPLLRQAVATCAKIREVNFREMQQGGIWARDEASKATWVVIAVSAAAVLLASLVAGWLARSILLPVRDLTASVEALRQGDFDRRVRLVANDELGQLALGFNRMAEALGEYRRSSLGELLAAKTTLEATLNALPNPVMVIAPDGSLAALNPPAKAVLESKRAHGSRRLQDLPLAKEEQADVQAALAGRRRLFPRPDFQKTFNVVLAGQRRRFLLTAVPIPEFAPRQTGAVVVLDDVTEFARLDELRSELIGVASHELKSPLTTLRMNLLMLAEKDLTGPQKELLTAAIQGCEELGGTIEELLDVTRIEAGQLRLNLAPVDVEAVLGQVRRGLQSRFDDAGVRLQIVRDAPSCLLLGDAARLGGVFSNLLTNALKYSPHGSTVLVRVSSRQNALANRKPTLQIAVTDQGPGIPEEFRERVFEKFFRVEHQLGRTDRPVRGTGIGLYLCREIVKAHGGTILCESGEGSTGTRIATLLPLMELPQPIP